MEKIIDEILDKKFKSKLKGYDKEEVDNFLNEVLDKIEPILVENTMENKEYEKMELENFKLKKEVLSLKKVISEQEKKLVNFEYDKEKKLEELEFEIKKIKGE